MSGQSQRVHRREKQASHSTWWRWSPDAGVLPSPLPQTHAEIVGSRLAVTTPGTLSIPRGSTGLRGLGRGRGRARRRGSAQGRRLCARGRSPSPPRVPQLLCRCGRGTSLRGYRPQPQSLAPRSHVSFRPVRNPPVAQRVPAPCRCLGSPVPNADSARVTGGSQRTRPALPRVLASASRRRDEARARRPR